MNERLRRRWCMRLPGLLVMLALLPGLAVAQPQSMEIFALKYRTAEQLIALIRPLVPPPGTVTGLQNQLIVRTTAQNMAEIRAVLERVDTAPRRLLITVRQDGDASAAADRASAGGRVVVGRGGELSVGSPGARGLDVEVASTQRSEADRGSQQIQVLEGQPAFIQVGQAVPVPVRQVVRGPFGTQVVETTEYRQTGIGFQVLARLSGEQVFLDILPQREAPGRAGPGSIDSQQLATTVSGRLGEWIELGGISRSSEARESVLLGRAGRSSVEQRQVRVRVEELR